jgi:tRNA (guanine-N7-)-methyltransferase
MEQSSNRTYRLRGSRITGPQQSALDKYWGTYGHEYSTESLNITSLFPIAEQVVLEIGFGMGEATALIARDFPNTGFGCDDLSL